MKDLKSNDGDAASPLEMISNGRISRSMITTELQNFVPVGQLCHVKAQSKSKGSNLATVCRSELAVAVGMVSGVVKWMDVKTKARDSDPMTGSRSITLHASHGKNSVGCPRNRRLYRCNAKLTRK